VADVAHVQNARPAQLYEHDRVFPALGAELIVVEGGNRR
jgi:hypothetical protein